MSLDAPDDDETGEVSREEAMAAGLVEATQCFITALLLISEAAGADDPAG